jgi:hypothetical protein
VKTGTLTQYYDRLTPEERFRLIVAAGARRDTAEQERLKSAGSRLTLSMRDYAPWSHAFEEVATLAFLEILEAAGAHNDAFHRWCDAEWTWTDEDGANEDENEVDDANEGIDATNFPESEDKSSTPDGEDVEDPIARRYLDLYLAQGFMLKTKVDGWKLFCGRLSIPPFALWGLLPGFERFRRALDLLEDNEFRVAPAFRPDGMLHWLSKTRPDGEPEPSMEQVISPQRYADELDEYFRERAEWWGG